MASHTYAFRHRLAYVVDEVCVVRYDNGGGNGHRRQFGDMQSSYDFQPPEKLIGAPC